MPLSPDNARALRGAALKVAQAHVDRSDAIVAAHENEASIVDIARFLTLDAFDVRDILARRGVVPDLQPKETTRRNGR